MNEIIYYYLAAFLFAMGLLGVLVKRNIISLFYSLQIILTSANLFLFLFSHLRDNYESRIAIFFIGLIFLIQLGVGLAVSINLLKKQNTLDIGDLKCKLD